MLYPTLQEVTRYREMTTTFGGYNHQLSCQEGQFFDMKNMTSQYFPILSPRKNRGIVKSFVNPQGILDKEELLWIDNQKLYINGEEKELKDVTLNEEPKTLTKMGAFVIIMPDKVWYNVDKEECGYVEAHETYLRGSGVTFTLCESNGAAITWNDAKYYETTPPQDGDYMMTTVNGKASLKVYSSATKVWSSIGTTYVQISAKGIGKNFEKEDGVQIEIRGSYIPEGDEETLKNIFVNKDRFGGLSTNTYIVDKTDDSITIPGILNHNITISVNLNFFISRSMPDMAYITECNNRLWGCSKDGHEIYCCKLGDFKNWNCFQGIATDSWAATVGSDGKFTGAITYLGYPMFFKEDSLIKIAVSGTGGHQIKETKCRGVQRGSHNSLSVLNETLFYKSSTCVCGYNGSLPFSISDDLGDVRYYDAVAGSVRDRYYISMRDSKGEYSLFAFDTKNAIWCKEDNTKVLCFCRHLDDLYYIDKKDNKMKSIGGTLLYEVPEKATEDKFDWFVESGTIGYSSPDNKYVSRINLRLTLEFGTNVDFYLQYDSSGEWEHIFNMSGKGTRTYSIPIIPKRCDHFKYKLTGKGGCKIHSITKTMEEGSDI